MSFNFSWGNPIAVRDAFEALGAFNHVHKVDFLRHDYLPHEPYFGRLEALLQFYLKDITGKQYRVMLTPGGLPGVQIAVESLQGGYSVGYDELHFSFYRDALPGFAIEGPANGFLFITASPSNPDGVLRTYKQGPLSPIIWDMAYNSFAYTKTPWIFPEHTVAVGSIGKTIGLPGLRLGFLATESEEVLRKCWHTMMHNSIGFSTASSQMVESICHSPEFLKSATMVAGNFIDDNREMMTRLEYLANERFVPDSGMFWWLKPSDEMRQYFAEVSIETTPGSVCGADDSWMRINLAQNRELTKAAVNLVLRLDGKM